MINICLSFEDDYIVPATVLISSIIEHNKDFHIFAFVINVNDEQKKMLSQKVNDSKNTITFIDCSLKLDIFTKLDIKSTVDGASFSTYFRLLIPSLLPEKIDRYIYLDCDMVVRHSLSDIYSIDLGPTGIAACIDIMTDDYKQLIGLERKKYFNAGFLLVDVNTWVKKDYTKQALDILKKYPSLRYCDQDALNLMLQGNFVTLPIAYNYMIFYHELSYEKLLNFIPRLNNYYTNEEYAIDDNDIVVIHFVYSLYDRPWFKHSFGRYKSLWRKIAEENNMPVVLANRKLYSRTRVLQIIYKCISKKIALSLVKKRNAGLINEVANGYKEKGYLF